MSSQQLSKVALLVLLSAASSPVTAADVPLADFARHPQFISAKLSPHGDYLAATIVLHDQTVLSLMRLSDHKGVNVVPRGDRDVYRFWWVAPDRLMYALAERGSPLDMPSATGELFGVNADGSGDGTLYSWRGVPQDSGRVRQVSPHRAIASMLDPMPDDPKFALIETMPLNGAGRGIYMTTASSGVYPEVDRIDVRTGATTKVVTSPMRNASFLTDHDHVVRFAYGYDIDFVYRVWYRAGDDQPWELVFDGKRDGQEVAPVAFDRAQDAVYFECPGAHGVGGFCIWDLKTRKLSTLWSGTEAGLDPENAYEETFDGRDILAIRSLPGRPATTIVDRNAPEAKVLADLLNQFQGEDVYFTSHSQDGRKALFKVESDVDPGRFYLYDADAKKATFLFARRPWIDPAKMAPKDPIALKARDGLPLHGYLTRPVGEKDGKDLPLVVFVHGGPFGIRDRWDFDPYVQVLASRGYAVLQVNFRGSGGYGDAFEHAGYRQWGGTMQDDVTDATIWAVTQGIADPKRLCIFGGSYGGYAALEGVVREPDLYRCAIGYAGVYDLKKMYSTGDVPESDFGTNYLKQTIGTDAADLWKRSPIAHVDRIKAKVMLIVGGQDWRVAPEQGIAMREALDKAHVANEWLYRRTEGHGFYTEPDVEDLFAKVLAFLDANIGAAAGGSAAPH